VNKSGYLLKHVTYDIHNCILKYEIRSLYGLKMEAVYSSERLVPSTLLPTPNGVTT